MARRILNRKELRADYDAAERRQGDEEAETDEEEEEEEEEGDEEEGDEEAEEDEEAVERGEDEEGEEEEEEKKPKKRKPKKPAAPRAKTRRQAKVIRMRVVWGVFNNSNQCVATYAYPKKNDAVEHATRLTNDKRTTHFIQPVKEPIPEEK